MDLSSEMVFDIYLQARVEHAYIIIMVCSCTYKYSMHEWVGMYRFCRSYMNICQSRKVPLY